MAPERAKGLKQVTFVDGNPADMTFDRPFDAIIGRHVLQFFTYPADMLRRLARHLAPCGLMVWHAGQSLEAVSCGLAE